MCFFFSFMPATFWVVIGYFVMFTSRKAEGNLKKYGSYLAIWIFVIACFFPICGAYVTLTDTCPIDQIMELIGS